MKTLFTTLCLAIGLAGAAVAGPDDRYVIIGGNVAEIFDALEPDGTVVGIGAGFAAEGRFAGLPVVRGFRLTSAEALLSLRPTVIMIAQRQTTPELLTKLQGTGVSVEVLPQTNDLPDVQARLARMGRLLDRQDKAAQLSDRLAQDWAAALAKTAGPKAAGLNGPRGIFVLSGGGRGNLAGGTDSLAARMIEWAGGHNLTTHEGHKPLSQEAMAALAPDFIMTNAEGMAPDGGEPALFAAPGIALTPAYRNKAMFAVPGGYLTETGLRTPEAILFLADKFGQIE